MVYVRVHTGLHQGAEVEMLDSFSIEAAGGLPSDAPDKAILSIIDAGGPLKLDFSRVDRLWRCRSATDVKLLFCGEQGQPMESEALLLPCFLAVGDNLFSLVEDTATPFVVPSAVSDFFQSATLLTAEVERKGAEEIAVEPESLALAARILRPVNALAFLGLALVLGTPDIAPIRLFQMP